MVAMRLRRVPVGLIVDSRITAVKAGIEIGTDPAHVPADAAELSSPLRLIER